MANVRNGNTFYIDSTSPVINSVNIRVKAILLTATAASGRVVLQDVTTNNIKADLRVATSGESRLFEFDKNPIVFPNGINPSTVTNAVATLIVEESRG